VDDFTCITFKPDLGRFKMDSLDKDIIALFTKRAYDMAGVLVWRSSTSNSGLVAVVQDGATAKLYGDVRFTY
jgi:hypothetical protein